jgi:UDP-glucose 6-dehydrogenase
MGEHWDTLSGLMQSDARFGSSHFSAPGHHGLGYSGSCFPKDTQALVTESNGELSLLQATIASNNKLRSVE